MITSIIFDVDGTLVDSVDLHARAWQRIFAQWAHPVAFEAIRAQIGKGGDQLMPVFLSAEEVEREGEAIEAARGALFKAEYLDQVRPFPGVAALFGHVLGQGQKIALGSSGKPEEIEHYRRLLGIDGMDMVVTSSADAKRSKPYPDIFQAALQQLGASPDQAVAVGDSPYDATAAGRAGIMSVGVLCGGFAGPALREAGCAAVFDGPADLLARFARSPLSSHPVSR